MSSIRTRRRTESWSAARPQRRNAWPSHHGGAACLLPICRWIGYKGRHTGICLYMRQRVRIVCGEDRKDESSDMVWVKRFIIFLVVGFFSFT